MRRTETQGEGRGWAEGRCCRSTATTSHCNNSEESNKRAWQENAAALPVGCARNLMEGETGQRGCTRKRCKNRLYSLLRTQSQRGGQNHSSGEVTWRTEGSRGRVLDCEAAMFCKQEQHAPHTLSSLTQAMMLLTHHCRAAMVMVDAPPPPKVAMTFGGIEESEEQP